MVVSNISETDLASPNAGIVEQVLQTFAILLAVGVRLYVACTISGCKSKFNPDAREIDWLFKW